MFAYWPLLMNLPCLLQGGSSDSLQGSGAPTSFSQKLFTDHKFLVPRDFLARSDSDSDGSYKYNCDENGDDTKDSINPDEGMPPSDRELRPRVDWINEAVAQGDAQCFDENGDPTDDYDNCDNGGSGNCEL
jgi:hypothetical protein